MERFGDFETPKGVAGGVDGEEQEKFLANDFAEGGMFGAEGARFGIARLDELNVLRAGARMPSGSAGGS